MGECTKWCVYYLVAVGCVVLYSFCGAIDFLYTVRVRVCAFLGRIFVVYRQSRLSSPSTYTVVPVCSRCLGTCSLRLCTKTEHAPKKKTTMNRTAVVSPGHSPCVAIPPAKLLPLLAPPGLAALIRLWCGQPLRSQLTGGRRRRRRR